MINDLIEAFEAGVGPAFAYIGLVLVLVCLRGVLLYIWELYRPPRGGCDCPYPNCPKKRRGQ